MPSVLITGANRGLGLEFARQYAADVWQVYAGYRDLSSASKLRRLANTSDDKIRIMALDVTDPASIKAAVTNKKGKPSTSSLTMLASGSSGSDSRKH